jgi:hypothetical protein
VPVLKPRAAQRLGRHPTIGSARLAAIRRRKVLAMAFRLALEAMRRG